jgi:hypothetical protein
MKALLFFWCVVLCGCARRPAGVNYLVSRDCKPQVRLLDCDHASPPHCRKMAADFPRGCEQLLLLANH